MRAMFARLVEQLRLQRLTPEGETAVARFRDIVIQDGSSFALKPAQRGAFPGRFTTIEPAAVEVHAATYSGCADEVRSIHIAPDADAERTFLPEPATLTEYLLLADRGDPSVGGSRGGWRSTRGAVWISTSTPSGARASLPRASSSSRGARRP